MNKLFDTNLVFDEDEHKYTLLTNPDLEFTSTTTFIHKFFRPFEAEKVAEKLVTKVPKYRHMSKQELLDDWKKSATDGTDIHKTLEVYALNRRTRPKHSKAKQGVLWLKNRVYNKPHLKVYPEVTLFAEDIKISGTIDLLIHNKNTNEYVLADWKTNKAIYQESYRGTVGTHKATKSIMDCNYMHYCLQLSMYRYILEKYYGLAMRKQYIVHLKDTESIEYSTPFYQKTIEEMLNADKF